MYFNLQFGSQVTEDDKIRLALFFVIVKTEENNEFFLC